MNTMGKSKYPSLKGVNIIYMITVLLMVTVPYIIARLNVLNIEDQTDKFLFYNFALSLLIIGLPAILYLVFAKKSIKAVRPNKLPVGEALLIFVMAIFGFFALQPISLLWMELLKLIGKPIPQYLPPITNGYEYLLGVLFICVAPAVVEEFLFRGIVLRGYERYGIRTAIIMSGLLFSVLHLNLSSLLSISILGIILSYIVIRTNSILAGVIYHFVHNLINVSLLYMQSAISEVQGQPLPDVSSISGEIYTAAIIFWTIAGIGCLSVFIFLLYILRKKTAQRYKATVESTEKFKIRGISLMPLAPAVFIVVWMYVQEIITMIRG